MRSSKDRSALFDIRDNAALARDFVGSVALDEFKADRRAFYAATRAPKSYQRLQGGFLPPCASAIRTFPGAQSWGSETSCATITMMSRKSRFGAPFSKTFLLSTTQSRQR